ncbi:hypothetical protein GC175_13205 [bacterium]|nr:hypothetical protein [bacterium]
MKHILSWRITWLTLSVGLFLLLAGYQLGLPGLHYDEAKEAGVNAMELLTAAPVTAFRQASLQIGALSLPLMVQDYIGALNVYLVLPFLAATGIGVPNLRFLPIVLAVVALLCLERALSEWFALRHGDRSPRPPISLAALFTLTLLVASPSFVFWNRQGIFVTNATLAASYLAIWQGIRWLRTGRDCSLLVAAFAAGIALYAKLLAIWLVAPLGILLLIAALRLRRENGIPLLSLSNTIKAAIALFIPLMPLVIFNVQTGGTFQSIGGNLGQSYYGVDNLAIASNLPVRLGQLLESLRGGQFWYLGGIHANPVAPWIWGTLVFVALILPRARRLVAVPVLLLASAVALSLFTVSDLFITHYALIQPVAVALTGLSLVGLFETVKLSPRPAMAIPLVTVVLSTWLILDVAATVNYHRDLARSGGLADHADAGYHLAYHLQYNGMGAPIVLDWGMEAPVRFLSRGSVRPIEIFGYESPIAPDEGFAARLRPFLAESHNVYLLRAPGQAVFQGRREVFLAESARLGKTPIQIATFTQKDGTPLFEIWRTD